MRCAPGYGHNDITVLIIGKPNKKHDGWAVVLIAARTRFVMNLETSMEIRTPSLANEHFKSVQDDGFVKQIITTTKSNAIVWVACNEVDHIMTTAPEAHLQ